MGIVLNVQGFEFKLVLQPTDLQQTITLQP